MTAGTTAPHTVRLLADYRALGRPAGLRDHVALHGGLPPAGTGLIQAVEEAGLTGRGGGAFPTGRKMRSVAAGRRSAVVVVNAAEGEPASGKDRLLLTVSPHLVLDGAALAAEAVGARQIVVCVHADDDVPDDPADGWGGRAPGLPAALQRAVAERAQAGLAAVPMRVVAMPPRYVASEETALIAWINGGDALPSFTPPRPFERGVGGRPTMVSNAETYAHIALIARHGAAWFRSCGSPDAPGTALFTLSGAIARPGVVEAPLGTPVGEIIRMAGGPARPLQAVLAGGYGGTWLPPALLDLPTTPASFRAAGAALGPGILIALPEQACGVAETARILRWLADETAGQCGPCVYGLPSIADDFDRIAACRADAALYQRLERRLEVIPGRGACAHPDGAVRLAVSALRVFGPHLRMHARAGGCLSARAPSALPIPEGW